MKLILALSIAAAAQVTIAGSVLSKREASETPAAPSALSYPSPPASSAPCTCQGATVPAPPAPGSLEEHPTEASDPLPVEVIEVWGSMSEEPAEVDIAELADKPAEAAPQGQCTAGMFRCTSDSTGFDTCVYGRWGTIRTCGQGTKCITVADNSIACA